MALVYMPHAHQPRTLSFPLRSFGSKEEKRSFKATWFDTWPWLHYREVNVTTARVLTKENYWQADFTASVKKPTFPKVLRTGKMPALVLSKLLNLYS